MCTSRMLLTSLLVLPALAFVGACSDVNRRSVLVVEPEQPICVPNSTELTPSHGDLARNEPYYITVGHAELESTAPRDDVGGSDDNFAFIRRRDAVIEKRIQEVLHHRQLVEERLGHLMEEKGKLSEQELDTAAVDERIQDEEEELDRLSAEVRELRQMVSGRTPTLSREGTRILFNDWPMPFRVYEGDTVEVRVSERDPFQNDLLGHTSVVVDSVMLETGRVELRTGWVQSLSLGFAPCDEEGDAGS